ncbi:MAG: hypothetical protein ACHQIK_16480 [Candidatus Acidiferrales bacterium]|jgi:hypothetical protein
MPKELIDVTEAARDFLTKSGYFFFQLEKTDFDAAKKQWILTFNVNIAAAKLKKVLVDDATGKVLAIE